MHRLVRNVVSVGGYAEPEEQPQHSTGTAWRVSAARHTRTQVSNRPTACGFRAVCEHACDHTHAQSSSSAHRIAPSHVVVVVVDEPHVAEAVGGPLHHATVCHQGGPHGGAVVARVREQARRDCPEVHVADGLKGEANYERVSEGFSREARERTVMTLAEQL